MHFRLFFSHVCALSLLTASLLVGQAVSAAPAEQEGPAADSYRITPTDAFHPSSSPVEILRAIDGDTLLVSGKRRIRLACIDAPDLSWDEAVERELLGTSDEREKNFRLDGKAAQTRKKPSYAANTAQYFARSSQYALQDKAAGYTARLLVRHARRDAQGRTIADLVLEDGTSLSKYLVAGGYAYFVHDANYPEDYQNDLIRLQQEAIRLHRGFWKHLLSLPVSRTPCIGTKDRMLFYIGSDVRGQKIKPRLRVYFGTLFDAFSNGYAPARSTDFWPARLN